MRLMPCTAAHRRVSGVDVVRQPRQIACGGVGRVDAGPTGAVVHDRYRSGTDINTLEQVKVHAQRIGKNRFDDVTVAHRHPHGLLPVLGFEGCIMASNCCYGSSLHPGHGFTTGEDDGGRLRLHHSPQILLG